MLWALPGAIVVIVAALILLVSGVQDHGVSGFKPADGRALFRALEERMAQVNAIAVVSGDNRVTLERRDGDSRWRLAESDGYPVREGAAEQFLRSLTTLRAAYVGEESSPPYQKYGLNEPGTPPGSTTTMVSVHDGDGEPLVRAAFGNAFAAPDLPADRGVFVRVAGDPRVWLTDREVSVPARRDAWLDNTVMDIAAQRVRRLTLSGTGTDRIVMARGDEGELRLVEGLPEGTNLKGPWVLDMLAGLFEQVAFDGVRAADTLPAEADQVRVATVETDQGVVYTVRVLSTGDDPAAGAGGRASAADDIWVTVSAAPADGADPASARRAEQFAARHAGWAYLLPLPLIDDLSVRPEDVARGGAAR